MILAKVNHQRIGKMNGKQRGGFGTRRQARPNPRTTANLNRKSKVVA